MNYPDSVEYLYSLGNESKVFHLGLKNIRQVLGLLGEPQHAFKVIHVAGTNGKGSTCAMIDAALRTAGVRTGLYTSPHLIEPTERIRIAGQPVTREQFLDAFTRVHEAAKRHMEVHPSYFETVTAMGFLLFRDLGIETAVVEVGLGGRLDATNVVSPHICVITPVDFDHEKYLGTTLEAIAGEKAAILKPGAPAIFASQRPEAERVLTARAAEIGIPVTRTSDYRLQWIELDAYGCTFRAARTVPVEARCPLAGEHQLENALAAVAVLEQLGVDPAGIANAHWPGRLERIAENPDIFLDGAHNPAGARALVRYIREFHHGRRIWLICGFMRDKSVQEMAEILFPAVSEVVATAPSMARSLRPETLLGMAEHPHARASPSIKEALEVIRREAAPGEVVFITGSLYLVGEARALFVQ